MQDVIFSGTENRKPLSYASVAITLDNSDHQLPVDYSEVTVTRKLYRSGESEYLINGTGCRLKDINEMFYDTGIGKEGYSIIGQGQIDKILLYRSGESEYLINGTGCRLKDINEMFYDTGIGKEGYSIIGQGQIDKILSGKPEERRELFDEAAGMVKFKRRKTLSLKKLEEEQNNLTRVSDILSELEKQIGPLEKQSAVAKEYLKKKEELKSLKKLEEEQNNLTRVSDILSELEKQIGPLEKQSAVAKEYLKKKEELKVYDIHMFLLETERLKDQLQGLEEKVRITSDEMEAAKSRYEETKEQYQAVETQVEEIDAAIEKSKNQLNETTLRITSDEMEAAKSRYEETKEQYQAVETQVEEIDAAIEKSKNQLNETTLLKQQLEGQINVLKEQINTARINEEHYANRRRTIQQEWDAKKEQKAGFVKDSEAIHGQLERISNQDTDAKEQLIQVQSQIAEETMDAKKEQKAGFVKDSEAIHGQLERISNQDTDAKEQLIQVQSQIAEETMEIEQSKEEIMRLLNNRASTQAKIQHFDTTQQQITTRRAQIHREILEVSSEAEQYGRELEQQRRASTQAKIQHFDTTQQQITTRRAQIHREILEVSSEAEQYGRELEQQRRGFEEITAEIQAFQDLISVNEQNIAEFQRQLDEKQEKLRIGQTAYHRESSRLESLKNITERYDGYGNSIRRVMSCKDREKGLIGVVIGQTAYHRESSRLESLKNITERYDGYGNSIRRVMSCKDREKGLIGVVADIIKVEKEYEIAVETALGGSIQNIVTDDEETAKRMIAYLKQNKYGRATFLPLTSMQGGAEKQNKYGRATFLPLTSMQGGAELRQIDALKETGVIGLAHTLVHVEERFLGLAKQLLGRTIVVENIDCGIRIARKYKQSLRLVTLEGELINPGGSMTGGAFKNSSNLWWRILTVESGSQENISNPSDWLLWKES